MAFKAHQEINMIAPLFLSNATNPLSRWQRSRSISEAILRTPKANRVRSTEQAVEMMKLTKKQIEVTMFAAGVGEVKDLGPETIESLE